MNPCILVLYFFAKFHISTVTGKKFSISRFFYSVNKFLFTRQIVKRIDGKRICLTIFRFNGKNSSSPNMCKGIDIFSRLTIINPISCMLKCLRPLLVIVKFITGHILSDLRSVARHVLIFIPRLSLYMFSAKWEPVIKVPISTKIKVQNTRGSIVVPRVFIMLKLYHEKKVCFNEDFLPPTITEQNRRRRRMVAPSHSPG